jgi:S1-C subfamily serine protease
LRVGAALAIAVLVPLVLVEGILRKLAPEKHGGVATDAIAVLYVGFALAFVGVAHGMTKPLLVDEAARLDSAGYERTANLTYFLAGGQTREHAYVPPVVAKGPVAPAAPLPPVALKAGDGKERTPAQIFTEFAPSVVTITVKSAMGEGGGTGFVIDAGGTIGTNYHVIDGAKEIGVKLMDGTVATDVEILAESQTLDLALIHVKTPAPLPPVVLGDSDKVTVGERAVSIGNPLGLDHTLTDGLVSSRRVMEGRKMIQMSTPVSPGNSGGPLFDSRGEVIGISTAIFHGGSLLAQNLNLAVPIDDLKSMLHDTYPNRHKPGDAMSRGGSW